MDIATAIIFSSLLAFVGALLLVRHFRLSRNCAMWVLLLSQAVIWFFTAISGELVYTWAGNTVCSSYLGCVGGFAGYDAFEHFLFGLSAAFALVFVCEQYPDYCIAPFGEQWKKSLVVLAVVVLVAVLWEILEFAHDVVRFDTLNQSLRTLSLHINLLDQPSNLDTMGDLIFHIFGAIIGFRASETV